MKIRSIVGLALAVFACLKIVDLLDAWHFEWLFTQPWTEFIAPCIMFYALCFVWTTSATFALVHCFFRYIST